LEREGTRRKNKVSFDLRAETRLIESMHSPPGEIRKFSKAKPLARQLGICPKTLQRWGIAGKVPRYRVNSRMILYGESEVVAFVESFRTAAAN